MSARTHTDVVTARQPVGHLGRIDVGDIQCHDGAAIACITSAIHLHAGNARHSVGEMLRKRARILVHAGGPAKCSLDVANTETRPSPPRHARSACPLRGARHEKRVALVIAVRARASLEKRGDFGSAGHAQTTGPLRALQAFMARKAHHVGADFSHVQRIRSSCLRGIEHEFRARFMGHGAHARHIVHIAREVRRMRNRDQRRFAFEQFGIHLEIKRAIGGDRRNVNRAASRIAQANNGRSTELCDAAVVSALWPGASRPSMAILSAIVALFVNATLEAPGAPSKFATAARARYTAIPAAIDAGSHRGSRL